MLYQTLANLVLAIHAAFIVFAIFGGLLALRWRPGIWLHLPCMAWGSWVIAVGWECPLTPLENALRQAGGSAGYSGGFIEHYLLAFIYPDGLTRAVQMLLAAALIAFNAVVYGLVWRQQRQQQQRRRARR